MLASGGRVVTVGAGDLARADTLRIRMRQVRMVALRMPTQVQQNPPFPNVLVDHCLQTGAGSVALD